MNELTLIQTFVFGPNPYPNLNETKLSRVFFLSKKLSRVSLCMLTALVIVNETTGLYMSFLLPEEIK